MRIQRSSTTARPALLTCAGLVLLTATIMTAGPASAGNGYDPNYRFCVAGQADPFGSLIPDCSFNTYEQCQLAASGMGYCIDNPVYAGAPAQRTRAKASR